jgi:hypothetical protein
MRVTGSGYKSREIPKKMTHLRLNRRLAWVSRLVNGFTGRESAKGVCGWQLVRKKRYRPLVALWLPVCGLVSRGFSMANFSSRSVGNTSRTVPSYFPFYFAYRLVGYLVI